MQTFRVEQYELWTQTYEIEADTPSEAIATILRGESVPADESSFEYIELCEDRGLLVKQNQDLAKAIESHGVAVAGDVIPTIRSVEHLRKD